MSNCNCHQEIIRDGSGRLTRYLKALDPTYAPIDDRSLEELLAFIQKYAARIRFYDIPDSKIEDGIPPEKVSWENFFKNDMAVIAASVGVTDTGTIKRDYDAIRNDLEVAPEAGKLAELFKASIRLAAKINDWHSVASRANPMHNDLDVAIHSILASQLQRIIAYEEGYKLINAQKPLNLDYGDLDSNELWGSDQSITADATIYAGTTEEEKVLNAALYADEIFNSFLAVVERQTNKSEAYLQFALEQYPAHQPHMALFIAFLQLFQLAQQQMNGLTERMLDYYYKDVLQLTPKEPLPDKVHVVFELAKNVTEYELAENTLLKAGKDAGGAEQVYATNDDLVINQAKVKEIKTIFIEKATATDGNKNIQTIYANPVADSADGNGRPFEKESDIKWETFGRGLDMNIINSPICRALGQMNGDAGVRNYAMPGFAIASPQLVLGGGNRLITLVSDGLNKLNEQFRQNGSDNPLTIWLSGEKGWLKINKMAAEGELDKIITEGRFNPSIKINEPKYGFVSRDNHELVIFLPLSADPVVAYDAELHEGYHYPVTQPVMQIMLNPALDFPERLFSGITVNNFSIQVNVGSINNGQYGPQMDGLQSLILQNDGQMFTAGKAINPFTLFPGNGKSFYIGSEEIFNKPLNQLSVNIRSALQDERIMVRAHLLKDKQWVTLNNNENDVFSYYDLSRDILQNYLLVNEIDSLERKPIVDLINWNPTVMKGFIRLDNQTSYTQKGEFPAQVSPQELAARFEIKEITVSYSSKLKEMEEGIDHFFHVYPFGIAEIRLDNREALELMEDDGNAKKAVGHKVNKSFDKALPSVVKRTHVAQPIREYHPGISLVRDSDKVDAGNKLLPQFTFTAIYNTDGEDATQLNRIAGRMERRTPKLFNALARLRPGKNNINQYSGNIQEEGILLIGLENAKPLQSISMLFQFAEGSANDEDNDPPQIHWSYLSHNQWRPLPGEDLITDGTYGFQATGIIKIGIPKDATNNDSIITSGLHWIRASVTGNANRIPMLINIVTQAVLATFEDNNNSPEHYEEALAAASISKLKISASQVGKVVQPFASFDGKPRELGKEFYTRVSERLRHKQRAVTAWDYEHLILDRFPSVYKVKCIAHTDPNCLCREKVDENDNQTICCGPQIGPGHVLLVPVASLKNRNGVDPLQPKTARRVLIEMVDYIKNLTSPFVKVYAKNPVYEQILVFFRVKFIGGTDIGFYLHKLNDEIVAYLTPWAFDAEAEIVFGQKVYASSIINFIEERPYVDFITDFEMGVCKETCCTPDHDHDRLSEDSPKAIISRFANCNDVETFLSENVEAMGEIVARPSTARSILVSAPHHIIIPYEAPAVLSPCEQRRLHKMEDKKVNEGDVGKIIIKEKAENRNDPVEPKKEEIKPKDGMIKKEHPVIIKKADVKVAVAETEATKKVKAAEVKKSGTRDNDVEKKKDPAVIKSKSEVIKPDIVKEKVDVPVKKEPVVKAKVKRKKLALKKKNTSSKTDDTDKKSDKPE